MHTKRFFITATGTGIGKTYITCMLTQMLREAGENVNTLKPVISGFSESEYGDLHAIADVLGLPLNAQTFEQLSLYRFADPLSPDMAARAANVKHAELDALLSFCNPPAGTQLQLIEGVGGVMVPLNEEATVRDWMQQLNIPVILVTGSYLGTLSHTLTAIHTLQSRNILIHAVVLNTSENASISLQETAHSLDNFIDERLILLPRGVSSKDPAAQALYRLLHE